MKFAILILIAILCVQLSDINYIYHVTEQSLFLFPKFITPDRNPVPTKQ